MSTIKFYKLFKELEMVFKLAEGEYYIYGTTPFQNETYLLLLLIGENLITAAKIWSEKNNFIFERSFDKQHYRIIYDR